MKALLNLRQTHDSAAIDDTLSRKFIIPSVCAAGRVLAPNPWIKKTEIASR